MSENDPADPPQRAAPKVRLRLDFGTGRIGPGKIDLLDAVGRTGSIAAAGRSMGMSYRRAWLLVSAVNAMFAEPAVVNAEGGGATLTPFGVRLIAAYRTVEAQTRDASAREFVEAVDRLVRHDEGRE